MAGFIRPRPPGRACVTGWRMCRRWLPIGGRCCASFVAAQRTVVLSLGHQHRFTHGLAIGNPLL